MADERRAPITLRQRIARWWWGVYLMEAENRRLRREADRG